MCIRLLPHPVFDRNRSVVRTETTTSSSRVFMEATHLKIFFSLDFFHSSLLSHSGSGAQWNLCWISWKNLILKDEKEELLCQKKKLGSVQEAPVILSTKAEKSLYILLFSVCAHHLLPFNNVTAFLLLLIQRQCLISSIFYFDGGNFEKPPLLLFGWRSPI